MAKLRDKLEGRFAIPLQDDAVGGSTSGGSRFQAPVPEPLATSTASGTGGTTGTTGTPGTPGTNPPVPNPPVTNPTDVFQPRMDALAAGQLQGVQDAENSAEAAAARATVKRNALANLFKNLYDGMQFTNFETDKKIAERWLQA